MGYAVFHMEKAHGTDSAMSAHIERTIHPKNADESKTHLNRELIEFPDGVENRTQAIQHRLDHAELTRKIGKNQVRAIRILLTGTHEDMKRIEQEGKLDEWCSDNLKYLADTFGKENIVSAVLHRDECTPHIHATLVPIVTGERKRKKSEEQVKKRYRNKPVNTPRLCADEIMNRQNLKRYQNTYALPMSRYGLKRGIEGSEAKHISNIQHYRDLLCQTEELQTDVEQLAERKQEIEKELKQAKKEVHTQRLKGAATATAANIVESVGSIFGNNRLKAVEQENNTLQKEVTARDESIETLQAKIKTMQTEHDRQLSEMQQKHRIETENKEAEHQKEITKLICLVDKLCSWFPLAKEVLRIEHSCRLWGFSPQQTARLIAGQEVEHSGNLYSEEYKRNFMTRNVFAKIMKERTSNRLILYIDKQPISEWFKEQSEKFRHSTRPYLNVNKRQKI